jgi:hypothetical protein
MLCAQAVVEAGYDFFIYDSNDGDCRAEATTSFDCPEGTSDSDYYDFYSAYAFEEAAPEETTEEEEEVTPIEEPIEEEE